MMEKDGYYWYQWNLEKAFSHLSDAVNIYDSLPLVRVPLQTYRYSKGSLVFCELALRDFREVLSEEHDLE